MSDQFVCDLVYHVGVVEAAAMIFKDPLHPQTRLVGIVRNEVVESATTAHSNGRISNIDFIKVQNTQCMIMICYLTMYDNDMLSMHPF